MGGEHFFRTSSKTKVEVLQMIRNLHLPHQKSHTKRLSPTLKPALKTSLMARKNSSAVLPHASVVNKAQLPANNVSKNEKRVVFDLKKVESIVILKANKGNCFVVMDPSDYNKKCKLYLMIKQRMKNLVVLNENSTRSCYLQRMKINWMTELIEGYTHPSDGLAPSIRGSVKQHKDGYRCDLLSTALVQLFITP